MFFILKAVCLAIYALAMLFGLLHWKPLADAAKKG